MTLAQYLDVKANLHAREEILNYRLLFDAKLAAAKHGYNLLTYYCDVDHDGFDIIFDDRYTVRKVQLKTVGKGTPTGSWMIHRSVLRPTRHNWEDFGFLYTDTADSTDFGVEGGVVLMEYDAATPDFPVTYFYTDIFIITAIALGHLHTHASTTQAAKDLRTGLPTGKLTEKISVAKGLFVEANSASNLLALLSLQSPERINWQHRVRLSWQKSFGVPPELVPGLLDQQIAEIPDVMKKVCGHDDP